MGFAVVWVCLLTHAELASSLVFISSLCDVMFSVFSCWAGCRVSVSAERRGLVQGGSWNSYGEEVQQRPVWRCLDWFHTRCGLSGVLLCMTLWSIKHRIWKMQKDLGSFQVISLIFMLFFLFDFQVWLGHCFLCCSSCHPPLPGPCQTNMADDPYFFLPQWVLYCGLTIFYCLLIIESFTWHGFHLCKKPCSFAIIADSFGSNWAPCVPVRADVLLCGLGSFQEFQHVPFVSSNWGHL